MDSTNFGNIVQYWREKKYPEGSSKQEKSVLRRFAKKFAFDAESNALFYVDTRQDGSTFKRMVIKDEEKLWVFQECHSSSFAGHVGRDNTIQKIKDHYYWPDYSKDTIEMVSKIWLRDMVQTHRIVLRHAVRLLININSLQLTLYALLRAEIIL